MKTLNKVLIVIAYLAVFVGIGLFIGVVVSDDLTMREITLDKEGETIRELTFAAENFRPGDVKEYTVIVHGDAGGEFDFTFKADTPPQGTLWKYLNFEIAYSGQSKAASLAAMFEGTEFEFDVKIDKEPIKFTVRYIMPKDVGNEAENLETEFSLILSAKRK